MSIDISAKIITPIRKNYGHIEERFGDKKTATRYQEAVYDLQPTANFHYRPLWDKNYELYDVSRTAIVMKDWYSFSDPRQYYYGTYTIARSKQQEVVEHNYRYIEKRELLDLLSEDVKQSIQDILIPLRHVEWGANMNNCEITDKGYGATICTVAMFNTIDRLAIAQYITRISLLIKHNEEDGLDKAKKDWIEKLEWQKLRHTVEDMFVIDDWFELMVAQNFILDGLIYPLFFDRFEKKLSREGGGSIGMLTEFMNEWYAETVRWTNSLAKVTAAESESNNEILSGWFNKWLERISTSIEPIAIKAFGEHVGLNELATVKEELVMRFKKQGLAI